MGKIKDIILEPANIQTGSNFKLKIKTANEIQHKGTNLTFNNSKANQATIRPEGHSEQDILPSEYQQVEYIQSTGTQYINLNVNYNSNIGIKTKVIFKSGLTGDCMLLGARDSGLRGYIGFNTNQKRFSFAYNENYYNFNTGTMDYDILYDIDVNKNIFKANDSEYTFSVGTFTINRSIYLFAVNMSGSATQYSSSQIFDFKLYDNGTLIRDLIPCYRKSDTVIGMYDLVNNVFYTNSGTGTFLKGNNIPNPDYPQDMRVVMGDNNVIVSNKNIIPLTNQDFTVGGIRCYVENGTLILNGTSVGETLPNNINFKNNLSFTLSSGTYTIVGVKGFATYLKKYDDDSNIFSSPAYIVDTPRQFTLTGDTKLYIGFYFYQYTLNNLNTTIMISKGSTVTTYIEHKEQKAPLNLGMRNYFTASLELGSINDSTGATETNNNIIRSNDFIRVTPNATYSINNDKGYHTYIYEYNSSKTFLSAITTDTSNPKTFKASNFTRYIKIRTAEGENDTTVKFWLNLGKNASDTYYPPNTAPIRLFGIGDSNDLIIGKPDNWKVLRVIRELNLLIDDMDNIENYPGWQNQFQLVNDLGLTSSNTRLQNATQLLNNIGATYLYANANNNGTFWIDRNSFGNEYTQTYWKTNYQDLIFQLHYRITNPTAIVEEPITVPIVIEQLNNIYNLTSYDGQTNITATNILGGAQMIISASVEEGE